MLRPLPGIDMRSACPMCRQPGVLGQFSPRAKVAICKACTLQHAYDSDLLLRWDQTTYEERAGVIEQEDRVRTATVRPYNAPIARPMRFDMPRAIEMPFCQDCGCVHTNRSFLGNYHGRCLTCEVKRSVEHWYEGRLKEPYTHVLAEKGIDPNDAEALLDLIHTRHKQWFACGVLPDYWYELRQKDTQLA